MRPTPVTSGFRRRWTLAFLVGELVGFVPPAVTGAMLAAVGAPDAVLVIGLTIAGLFEGAAIGVAQSRVLARYAPAIDGRAWVVATMTAAGFVWFAGMGGGALIGAGVAPVGLLIAALVPAWSTALLSMGYAQWRVLRRVAPRSGRWIWVTSGAWLLGVMIPVVALSLAPNGWPTWAHAIVGVLAAVAMGITVGALTGRTLDRLLRAPTRSSSVIYREEDVVLSDGGTVHLRALRSDDETHLTRLFEQLSDESVYFRFFSPTRRSTAAQLELKHLDGTNHVALAALVGTEIVAVARYDRIASTEAEVALEVADAHQGRGIGTLLLQQLAVVARDHGIRTLSAVALTANARLFRMLADTGWPLERHFDAGAVRLRIPIDRSSEPSGASSAAG